ncbi:MAG: coproporphyrinogen dehydrogenase HemZ [Lachnospiraceae bacterium]|nr:coproporphyrinogen dehydrogenase HemZ [Lachnospiraceae bacterium]MDY3223325.1 coproporphyrinogen dehydrogenase HemZ [Lachnospiraceae bacterium]
MIVVRLNQARFEYDIHSLVKAFYPTQEVKVFLQEEKELESSPDMPELRIEFGERQICCSLLAPLETQGAGGEQTAFVRKEARQEVAELVPGEEKSKIKSRLKQLLYRLLSSYTGKKLPWGNLTGIRPVKIAYGLLEEGWSHQEIIAHMQSYYDASEEKAKLGVDIAERERRILAGLHAEKGYSLYVGIPFCPTTCLYCSFTSYPIGQWKKKVEAYLTALEKEMDYLAEAFRGKVLDTVYIGGGTPTTLEPGELTRLFTALQERFDFSSVKEFTVEAGRADSITKEKLQVMKAFGADRISVNPQTMKEDTLKLIGRQHTVEQAKEAFLLAREVGFTNINMDLILGLPEETREDVIHTMEEVRKLRPDSLTVHSLAIKRAAGLNQWTREHGMETLQNTEETMEIAAAGAKALGMKPYYLYRQKNMTGNLENVGYATEGNYGIYNILMMEEKQTIAAIGAGTVSKRVYPDGQIERCDNVKDVVGYMERIDELIERKRRLFED